jgi:hypothetical protein
MSRFYDIAVIGPTESANTVSTADARLSGITNIASSTSAPLSAESIVQGTARGPVRIPDVDVVVRTLTGDWLLLESKLGASRIRLSRPQVGGLVFGVLVAGRALLADTAALSVPVSPADTVSHSEMIMVGDAVAPLAQPDVEVEMRLTSPPVEYRKIPVRFRFVGKDEPRVFYDPERD